ncbi:MAG: PAS domain S-box protein [Bacteroidia bacterium]|nr:PAS domain S-box protein [Bacteroidia bacterium]
MKSLQKVALQKTSGKKNISKKSVEEKSSAVKKTDKKSKKKKSALQIKSVAKKTSSKSMTKEEAIKKASFPIVAIGASAGGLEAITELLKNLPVDTGMAFIYVQHLSPDHKSLLVQILSKTTAMKVQEIDNMDLIEPNNVFVIPFNKGIEVTDGHIKLLPRSKTSSVVSIDVLFSSLAEAQNDRVIGVLLSGNGNDGTSGMRDIKHQGGLTFAQNESAKFLSMPQSAIAAGAVDFILPPKGIALELIHLSKHPFVKNRKIKVESESLIENDNPDLKKILGLLHKTTGGDFTLYKMNTIKRRIVRRMLLYRIKTISEYVKLLNDKVEEVEILYQDLLINVTSFFRETDTYKYLKSSLLPRLIKNKKDGETLRIWVPACSTGEEAYSIAMMLMELQDDISADIPIQIFGSDLSERAIAKARIGLYTLKDLESISPKRIQRFFTKSEGAYRIIKSVRDLCVFAPHNVLSDPPFSRLDFVSCCNLFIYLDNPAQKKAVRTFHYSLNENGFLMVGKSESIDLSTNLFVPFNKKFKIYVRKKNIGVASLPALSPRLARNQSGTFELPINHKVSFNGSKKKTATALSNLETSIDSVLLKEFIPANVTINYNMEIQHFKGPTELYLANPTGKATFNILKMAKPEIAFELRNTISKVIRTKHRVIKSGIEFLINNQNNLLQLEILPVPIEWEEPLLLVVFTLTAAPEITDSKISGKKASSVIKDKRIKKLEEELALAHADALAFSQEQENFMQELQSANEEVVSSNEELQTLNEELETSKEEIESANEELTTTNQELQTRNDLLDESYNYSEAITATIHEPMIVLDKNLCVKSANRSFYKEFNVKEDEVRGIQLFNVGNRQWNIPHLRKLLEEIIPKNSSFHDYEVSHIFPNIGEKVMLLNANRIIQKTNREPLILLAIRDITELRTKTKLLKAKEKELYDREILEHRAEEKKLEAAVLQRTNELKASNSNLAITNAELLTINKELEAFTYISSHDMQEPLRKIQTYSKRIIEIDKNLMSENGLKYFKIIDKEAMRMQTLIKNLLTFSHLNTTERKFELCDLNKVAEEILVELKLQIKEKKAEIVLKNLPALKVIAFQFRQLLYNLISNSLKFTLPDTIPKILISSKIVNSKTVPQKNLMKGISYYLISISDNGIGFKKEFEDKIFGVFQRLHGKDEYAGTGIGLAIVKRIVNNHNGIVTACSRPGHGATFDIYIPKGII